MPDGALAKAIMKPALETVTGRMSA